jgi:hypothetical protein
MITGSVQSSILKERSKKVSTTGAKNTVGATMKAFKETIMDLEEYLDTSNLGQLGKKSLTIILDDILEIIKGLRNLDSKTALEHATTLDGLLENLRDAKFALLNAIDLCDENNRTDFYNKLRETRASLASTLTCFKN